MMRTLTGPAIHESVIKRSRFVARATRCETEAGAREFLQRVADPDATHNCWAWRAEGQYRFDDDGEPGGTAGRPILASIEGHDMDQVVVVVTRYYGGIKLGTGGLVRAYGGCAAECLRAAESIPIVPMTRVQCLVPFGSVSIAHQLLERYQACKLDEQYTSSGVSLLLTLPASEFDAFTEDIRNGTSGAVEFATPDRN